jgi:Fe-S oxidoreductase
MATWRQFTEAAPRISAIFARRHAAAGNLCMLATLRADGSPRISPIEPRVFEGELWLVGMPGTTKFRDLGRDPRFCLHTATVDPEVGDGDAKLWGTEELKNVADLCVHCHLCQPECPSGVDISGLMLEAKAAYVENHGLSPTDWMLSQLLVGLSPS